MLIFADTPADYTVTHLLRIVAYSLEALALLIGVIAIYNLRHSLSVAPQPIKKGRLEANCIYRYIRHPMYLSVFLVSIGITINSGSYAKFLIVSLILIFFRIKTEYEENLLVKKYPAYKSYIKTTGRYLPKIKSKNRHD